MPSAATAAGKPAAPFTHPAFWRLFPNCQDGAGSGPSLFRVFGLGDIGSEVRQERAVGELISGLGPRASYDGFSFSLASCSVIHLVCHQFDSVPCFTKIATSIPLPVFGGSYLIGERRTSESRCVFSHDRHREFSAPPACALGCWAGAFRLQRLLVMRGKAREIRDPGGER